MASAGTPYFSDSQVTGAKFKARYHRRVAVIYDEPSIKTAMPLPSAMVFCRHQEYEKIAKLGRAALQFIRSEMLHPGSEYGVYLGQAIMKITSWPESGFQPFGSLSEQNNRLSKRLIDGGLVAP